MTDTTLTRLPPAHPLACPVVHLNGTSREGLIEQWRAVHEASEALLHALAEASPHGRDYYLQDGGNILGPSWRLARDQNDRRIRAVNAIRSEAEALVTAIQG